MTGAAVDQRSHELQGTDVKSVDASKEIAERMLQGWTLLADHCPRYAQEFSKSFNLSLVIVVDWVCRYSASAPAYSDLSAC